MTDVEQILRDRLASLGINSAELHRRIKNAGGTIDRATVYRWLTDGCSTLALLGPVLDAMRLELRPRRKQETRKCKP